jgi:hypothetical protein
VCACKIKIIFDRFIGIREWIQTLGLGMRQQEWLGCGWPTTTVLMAFSLMIVQKRKK